jgi:hypothetical protein
MSRFSREKDIGMALEQSASDSDFDQLFERARKGDGVQFLLTLVRVDGIQCYDGYEDEFLVLRRELNQPNFERTLDNYRRLASFPSPRKLLLNLVNCVEGKHYDISPFRALLTGSFPNQIQPTGREILAFVATRLRSTQFDQLAARFERSCRAEFFETEPASSPEFESIFDELNSFLKDLFDRYFHELALATKELKYLKLPGSLDVLELLADEEMGGLNGFRVHFPQGCKAEFFRTSKGVFGLNFEFGPPVTFLMTSIGPSSNEYRVEGKRLCEIPLPGRYNKLGQWKPLIYPGDAKHLIKECQELSDDPDVQGVLLYLRLTGHRCIEFALRANLELPGEFTGTESNDVLLWKCPPPDDLSNPNIRVYDGLIDLKTGDVEEIDECLQSLNWLLAMMFFPYGATYSWRNKYRMVLGSTGLMQPTHEEMKTVDSLLKRFPYGGDGNILSGGVDWYNMGNSSSNPFTRFLCYYVAFESVAISIFDGADLGIDHPEKITKLERRAQAINCIEEKHDQLFADAPIKFVEQAYFECVKGLKAKAMAIAKTVFGESHPYVQALFVKPAGTGVSLSDLRSELAHGGMTLLNQQHENLIRHRVYEMGNIAREFLLRVLFRLRPDESVPAWSQHFALGMSTADPRTTMWTTTDKVFPPGTSWKIRPEWCE